MAAGTLLPGQKPDSWQINKKAAENKKVRQALNAQIKEGAPARIFLLYGDERFLVRSYRDRLKAAIIGDDTLNLNIFRGEKAVLEEVEDLAQTAPFFAEKRLIIIEESGWFKGESRLSEVLPGVPESTYLIFTESAADARTKAFKTLAKLGMAAELGLQSDAELSGWIAKKADRSGRKITRGAVQLVLDRVGNEMSLLDAELEKLIAYTEGREVIAEPDVEAVCSERFEDRVFDMIDRVFEGRRESALALYEELLALREPPIRILVLIERHCYTLLTVRELLDAGAGRAEITAQCGFRDSFYARYAAQARRVSRERLSAAVQAAAQADDDIKNGRLDEKLAVELLLMRFSE